MQYGRRQPGKVQWRRRHMLTVNDDNVEHQCRCRPDEKCRLPFSMVYVDGRCGRLHFSRSTAGSPFHRAQMLNLRAKFKLHKCSTNKSGIIRASWVRRPNSEDLIKRKPEDQRMTKGTKIEVL